MNKYEALMIFPSSLKEEDYQKSLDQVIALIAELGGAVLENRPMGRRPFAHPLKKKDSGYFVELTFSMSPDQVAPFRARCKLNENLFRLQVVTATPRPVVQQAAAQPVETGDVSHGKS